VSPRKPSRPPPPPGEFVVQIIPPGGNGLSAEVIERLCANEQEGWAVFYEHCRTKADVRLFRNGAVVARRFAPKESIPS
jgi:hypothetical protein